jgi:hypothetical protein
VLDVSNHLARNSSVVGCHSGESVVREWYLGRIFLPFAESIDAPPLSYED